jgi:hypothetical protein
MKRYANIVLQNFVFNINGFDNVLFNNIENLVNSSIDVIYCAILNKIPKDLIEPTISELSNKIRPGGEIVFILSDTKTICKLFSEGSMANDEFFSFMNNTQNLFFLPEFENIFDKHLGKDFHILNTELQNNNLIISLQRINNG